MKRTTQRSASTSPARSSGRKQASEPNIQLVRRELLPGGECRSGQALPFFVALAQLILLTFGLCLFLVSGFSLTVDPWLLYGGLVPICLLFAVFYFDNWLTGARIPGAAAIVLTTTVTVLFQQRAFLSGFSQFGCAILTQMNERYQGDYMIPLVTSLPKDVSVFLLLVFVPLTAYLGAFTVKNTDTMLIGLLVFPMAAIFLLLSAAPSAPAVACLLFGILSVAASDRVGYRRSLWGEKDSWQWRQNRRRQQKISAVSAVVICLWGILLAIPSFVILMPSLSVPLAQAIPFADRIQGQIAQTILTQLPNMYRGEFSAPLSSFGGGVAEGDLRDTAGYLVNGIEDLKLRCTQKPQETLYLRGFIGGSYSQNQWQAPDDAVFRSAAANWPVDGDPGIYIHNLPFLRMLYEQNEAGISSSMAELTVQRIHANDRYTYTPYGSYLNGYYRIHSGDGAVMGQDTQDDIFTFYFRSEQLETLKEEYFLQNESSLDRLERSYAAYVRSQYCAVPAGFEPLQAICDGADLAQADPAAIIAFVQDYLTQNYTYTLTLPQIPENADVTAHFLFQSKAGCSPHFASAAAIMFRMLGIPSRYVTGYAASESLFTPQPDGAYHALLQSDNAHAWVEIYIGGVGWIPIETTPGQPGLLQEIDFFGTVPSPAGTEAETPASEVPADPVPDKPDSNGTGFPVLTAVLSLAVIALLLAVWAIYHRRRRDLGLDRRMPPAQRIRCIFAAYYRSLLCAGLPPQIESTSKDFIPWLKKLDPDLEDAHISRMLTLTLESCFGQRPIREADILWMRQFCLASQKRLGKRPRISEKNS